MEGVVFSSLISFAEIDITQYHLFPLNFLKTLFFLIVIEILLMLCCVYQFFRFVSVTTFLSHLKN